MSRPLDSLYLFVATDLSVASVYRTIPYSSSLSNQMSVASNDVVHVTAQRTDCQTNSVQCMPRARLCGHITSTLLRWSLPHDKRRHNLKRQHRNIESLYNTRKIVKLERTGTIRRPVILVRDSEQDCHKINKFAMTQQDESTACDQQHGPLYTLAKIVFLENLHYRLDSGRQARTCRK